MGAHMHRIEVTLPDTKLGLALDSMTGNVVTRVRGGGAADMVGITAGVMLAEVNAEDVTELSYKETIDILKAAPRPLRLTVKSSDLLVAKLEDAEAIAPGKALESDRPGKNEFEVRLRNTSKSEIEIVKSGDDFIVRSVDKHSNAFKKGIHAKDEIIGVNGFDVVGHQLRGTLDSIFGKKALLRLRHHAEKFPPIKQAPDAPYERDIEFAEFPFGLELDNPPVGQMGAFVWKVNKKSFEHEQEIKKGDDLVGVDHQNVWHQPWSLVKHVVANAQYPCVLRFRRLHFPPLPEDMPEGALEVEIVKGSVGMDLVEDEGCATRPLPTVIKKVKKKSQADTAGLKAGDHILGMGLFDLVDAQHADVMRLMASMPRPFDLRILRGDIDAYRSKIANAKAAAARKARKRALLEEEEEKGSLDVKAALKKLRRLLAKELDRPIKEIVKEMSVHSLVDGNRKVEKRLTGSIAKAFSNDEGSDKEGDPSTRQLQLLPKSALEIPIELLAVVAGRGGNLAKIRNMLALRMQLPVAKVVPSATISALAEGNNILEQICLEDVEKAFGTPEGVPDSAAKIPLEELAIVAVPTSPMDRLRRILAKRLNIPLSEVSTSTTLDRLTRGDAKLEKEIIQDIEQAFGTDEATVGERAGGIPIEELAVVMSKKAPLTKLKMIMAMKLRRPVSDFTSRMTIENCVDGDKEKAKEVTEELKKAFGDKAIEDVGMSEDGTRRHLAPEQETLEAMAIQVGKQPTLQKLRKLLALRVGKDVDEIKADASIETDVIEVAVEEQEQNMLSIEERRARLKRKKRPELTMEERRRRRAEAKQNRREVLNEIKEEFGVTGVSEEQLEKLSVVGLAEVIEQKRHKTALSKLRTMLAMRLGRKESTLDAGQSIEALTGGDSVLEREITDEIKQEIASVTGVVPAEVQLSTDTTKVSLDELSDDIERMEKESIRKKKRTRALIKKAGINVRGGLRSALMADRRRRAGELELQLDAGPPGLGFEETLDKHGCKVCLVKERSLGRRAGFKVGDIVLRVGGVLIPRDETAYAECVRAIKNEDKPAMVLVRRATAAQKKRWGGADVKKHRLTLREGPLGMGLNESDDKLCCVVKVVQRRGQGAEVGFRVGDRIISVGGKDVPENEKAKERTLFLLQNEKRPMVVEVLRPRSVFDAEDYEREVQVLHTEDELAAKEMHAVVDTARPIAKEAWAEGKHNVLPKKCPPHQYEARWPRSTTFRKSQLKLTSALGGQGTEVKLVGNTSNRKKGIHPLDRLVGVQNVDLEWERHDKNLEYLAAALEASGKNRAIVLRFQHHEDKFPLLPKKPLTEEGEYDVTFKSHPIEAGLEMRPAQGPEDAKPQETHGPARVVDPAEGKGSEFVAQYAVEEGDEVIGVEQHDVTSLDFANVYHLVYYAGVPLTMRFRRKERTDLPAAPDAEKGDVDITVKKKIINRKLFFRARKIEDGGGAAVVRAVEKRVVGFVVVGVAGEDVSEYTGPHVCRIIDAACKIKKPGHLTLRLRPPLGDEAHGLDGASLADTREGAELSFRMMGMLKKKYKHAPEPPGEGEYDVVIKDRTGLHLCMAPNQKSRNGSIGAVIYSCHDMPEWENTAREQMCEGDRVVSVNELKCENGDYHDIDHMVFERDESRRGSRGVTVRFRRLKPFPKVPSAPEEGFDRDVDVGATDVHHTHWVGTSDFACCLKANPAPGTSLGEAKIQAGDRLVAVDGDDITALSFPGVIQLLHEYRQADKPHRLRFRSPTLRLRPDIPLSPWEVAIPVPLVEGGTPEDQTGVGLGWTLEEQKFEEDRDLDTGEMTVAGGTFLVVTGLKKQQAGGETKNGAGKSDKPCLAEELGFRIGDRITSVANEPLPTTVECGKMARKLLRLEHRPVRVVVYRRKPDIPLKKNEIAFRFEDGSLGLSLNQREDGACVVHKVRASGQGDHLGILPGDVLTSVANHPIPTDGDDAFELAMTQFSEARRPVRVVVYRKARPDLELRENELEFYVEKGSPGLAMNLNRDEDACVITKVRDMGQGDALGFKLNDKITSVGNQPVPVSDLAFEIVMNLLASEPRPVRVVVYRSPKKADIPLGPNDLEFYLEKGPIGMAMVESLSGLWCEVKSVKEGGQAHTLGFEKGDRIISVGNNPVPQDEDAFDVAMEYLKGLPRPLRVVCLRQDLDIIPLKEHEVEFFVEKGSLGLALAESDDLQSCVVKSVKSGKQGEALGFKDGDRITSVANKSLLNEGEDAYVICLSLLKDEPRPVRVVVYRQPPLGDIPLAENQFEFFVEDGSLGMALEEVDETHCAVKTVKAGGQGEALGFKDGDRLVSIGNKPIPEGEDAYADALTLIKQTKRPVRVVVYRQPPLGEIPLAENQFEFFVEDGSLGMALEEVDEKYCAVKTVKAGGQGEALGFKDGDRLVSIGNKPIPEGENAYANCLGLLKDTRRPVRVVCYRAPEAAVEPLEENEIAFIVEAASLGLSMEQVEGKYCRVKSVKPGAQGESLGFMPGDRIVRVGIGNPRVPENEEAFGEVMGYLKSEKRPTRVVVFRPPAVDDIPLQKGELEFYVEDSDQKLGLSLHEIATEADGPLDTCAVKFVKPGGQGASLGFQEGDQFMSVGNKPISKEEDNIVAFVTNLLATELRPVRVVVSRPEPAAEEKQSYEPLEDNQLAFVLEAGSLGLALYEQAEMYCCVKKAKKGGQARALGFQKGDRIVSIAGTRVADGKDAFDDAMELLSSSKRPVRVVVFRPSAAEDEPLTETQRAFILEAGPLGLSLQEGEGEYAGSCTVKTVTQGGQAESQGALVGDKIVSVGITKVPTSTEASDFVMGLLRSEPRPVRIVVERDPEYEAKAHARAQAKAKAQVAAAEADNFFDGDSGDDDNMNFEAAEDTPLEENEYEFFVDEGSLGMALRESDDESACVVNSVNLRGQAKRLGFEKGDVIVSVANNPIPEDETAFDVVMDALATEPRPMRVVVWRNPDNAEAMDAAGFESDPDDLPMEQEGDYPPLEENQIEFTINKGSIGMSLHEEDGTDCVVKSIKRGGQGDRLGFQVGDIIVNVAGEDIPEDDTAFEVVMDLLREEPRPVRVVVHRDPPLDDIPLEENETEYYFEQGSLGMSLAENAQQGVCFVESVNAQGQAKFNGVEVGDVFRSVANNPIARGREAFDIAMELLQDEPRPVRVVLFREPPPPELPMKDNELEFYFEEGDAGWTVVHAHDVRAPFDICCTEKHSRVSSVSMRVLQPKCPLHIIDTTCSYAYIHTCTGTFFFALLLTPASSSHDVRWKTHPARTRTRTRRRRRRRTAQRM